MKWQYRTLKFKTKGLLGGKLDDSEVAKVLNELGEQDWELTSTLSTQQTHGATREVVLILKRPN